MVVRNTVAVDYANYYELTVHYKETNTDQSIDMGKTFEAHINIKDPHEYNPYQSDKESLAYNIINNSIPLDLTTLCLTVLTLELVQLFH